MDVQGQLDAHIGGIKRDIHGLVLQLERIRRGEVERDILRQINHKHEIIALQRDQKERDVLRQINHKHEIMQAMRAPLANHSSESSSDSTLLMTSPPVPSASTGSTSFDSSQGSDLDPQTVTTPTSLPNFSTFLKTATSPPPITAESLVNPGVCALCGRPCSQGNMWRHRRTCLGRCLNCADAQIVCDDRGRGAPSHDCKACRAQFISCVYLDQGDGKWKAKAEFGHSTRFARFARKSSQMRQVEEERGWYGGV